MEGVKVGSGKAAIAQQIVDLIAAENLHNLMLKSVHFRPAENNSFSSHKVAKFASAF